MRTPGWPGESEQRLRAYATLCGVLATAVVTGCTAPGMTRATLPALPGAAAPGLVGETATALRAEFGPPVLLRRDGPAEVWLYRSMGCTVDLILYPDPRTRLQRVAVADVLPLGAQYSAHECLAGLSLAPGRPTGRIAAGTPSNGP